MAPRDVHGCMHSEDQRADDGSWYRRSIWRVCLISVGVVVVLCMSTSNGLPVQFLSHQPQSQWPLAVKDQAVALNLASFTQALSELFVISGNTGKASESFLEGCNMLSGHSRSISRYNHTEISEHNDATTQHNKKRPSKHIP